MTHRRALQLISLNVGANGMLVAVDIRNAAPSEAPVLTALAQAAKAHWGYTRDLLELWGPQLTVTADYILQHDVSVAVVDECVVGFCALESQDGVAEIEHLWVDPAWMGRGVGRALFQDAISRSRQAGVSVIRVVSDPHAEGFYLHMGARRVGQQQSVPQGRELPVLSLALVGDPSL